MHAAHSRSRCCRQFVRYEVRITSLTCPVLAACGGRDVLVKNSTCYAYVNDCISIDMIIGNAGEERKKNAFFTLFFIFINQSLLL